MAQYSLQDAQNHLKKLIDDAQDGKTVLILDENRAVQLVPVVTALKPRKAGSAQGRIKIAPDFDEPLSDFNKHSI